MKVFCFLWTYFLLLLQLNALEQCEKDFVKTTFLNGAQEINVLLIWFPINVGAESTLRICSEKTGLPLQRHCGYERQNNTGKWEEMQKNIKLINCSSIPNLCLEEPFIHNYLTQNQSSIPYNNRWRAAKMAERGDLQEPCLLKSGVPLTRLCEYNQMMHSAQWELLSPNMRNISCYRYEQFITYNLNTLHKKVQKDSAEDKIETKQVAENLNELLTTSQNKHTPADILLSTEILKIITEYEEGPQLVNEVLNITNIVMATDEQTIRKSEQVKGTTSFLGIIDNYLHKIAKELVPTDQCQNRRDGVVSKTINSTSVFYVNPACANITGVAIYKRKINKKHRFDKNTGQFYNFLYMNQSLEYILHEPHLLLATYFPYSLWNNLKTYLGSVNNETLLTFIIFKNDKLFVNHTKLKYKPKKNILEIKVSNYTGELPEDVPFIYGYPKFQQKPICGFWRYHSWLRTGINTSYRYVNNYQFLICKSNHLTHLGAVFSLSFTDSIMLNISHDDMLNYISLLGCGLSLLGLSCIWLTAICFKSFRVNPSNNVLLNMSLVLTLLMLFLILISLPKRWNTLFNNENILNCKIKGAFLHYIVITLFFWMLIISFMQYKRYVKVMGYVLPSNFVLKCGILGWGLPLIPVCIVAYLDGYTYDSKDTINNLCYPTGDNFTYGVILPTALIMLTNLGIFIYIFYSISRSLYQYDHHAEKRIKTQVRITVLLFFLMGISWLFGLLSHFENSPVCLYIFCFTSPLQGFILFIYAIIIDDQTRLSWIVLCYAKSYDTQEGKSQTKYINMFSRQTKIKK